MSYWDEYEWLHHCDSDEDSVKHGCLSAAACIVGLWLFLLLCVLLGGCKSVKYIKVPDIRTDTLYINKTQRDSIWLHDSVNVVEKQIGDTVYLLHDRWHTKYIESVKRDTTYIAKTDSVPVPYPVEVKVPRELNWWQKTLQRTGGVALILLLVWIGRMAWKIYTKRFY